MIVTCLTSDVFPVPTAGSGGASDRIRTCTSLASFDDALRCRLSKMVLACMDA